MVNVYEVFTGMASKQLNMLNSSVSMQKK